MRTMDPFRWLLAPLVGAVLFVPPSLALAGDDDDDGGDRSPNYCEQTASALRKASRDEAHSDFWVGFASCLNVSDRDDAKKCFRENSRALDEALDLLAEQFEARLDLCEALGGGRYDPEIDPKDFVKGVTNPFFPLVPGRTKVFEMTSDEGLEHVEVTDTFETRTILGVECMIVHDVARLDGEVVEDTEDYFAQDRRGNVWYFGEVSMSFEDGRLHDLHGSWIAGEDGARPGIVMEKSPRAGDVYRQEFSPTVAEDAARISALGRTVRVPHGTFNGCVETFDFSPLEPDLREAKFYAPGLGVVLEVDLDTGGRLELIGIF